MEEDDTKQAINTSKIDLEKAYKPKKTAFIIAGAAIILLVAGGAGGMYLANHGPLGNSTTPSASSTATTSASASIITTSASASPTSSLLTDEGVVWLSKPEKLSTAPTVFTNLNKYYPDGIPNGKEIDAITYYKVGTDHGHDIVYADINPYGPAYIDPLAAFISDGNNKYRILPRYSSVYDTKGNYIGPDLTAAVTTDTTTNYKALDNPAKLTVGSTTLSIGASGYDHLLLTDNSLLSTKLGDTTYGAVYKHTGTSDNDTPYYTENFYLVRPDSTLAEYQTDLAYFKDDNIPSITWNDGSKNTNQYRADGIGGCGLASAYAVLKDTQTSKLTKIGTTSTGADVLGFNDGKDNAVVKYFYSMSAAGTADSPTAATIEAYAADRPTFVVKDDAGRNILFNTLKYGSNVECGKPVVYLYPTKTTPVDVTVGAKITVSEPTYGTSWHVTAKPDGSLTTNDSKTYNSLYWEGLGNGAYPEITSGFMVAQKDLAGTVAAHLKQLGLNDKESADFMAFWLPRLPKTPYVRLTWFGTQQMNELAPLTVSPQPDTMIRIFLDSEGLQAPINLPTQHLSSIARKGFTVVEWGGLLRSK